MRLTLRTLLAYLDDRLSPANARELGQKIVKSPFATELADRIKSVVRRRRLAADSGEHKNIDANLIAEYLDDQLTPELVALIEKEILGSDHSLAEVAAVHQILGLLSDPVEISEPLTNRLHKLDPFANQPEDDQAKTETAADAAGWKPLAPQAAAARRSPMLLLVLMVVGWLALLFTDSHLFDNGTTPPVAASDKPDTELDNEAIVAGEDDASEEVKGKIPDGATQVSEPVSNPVAASDTPTDGTVNNIAASVPEKSKPVVAPSDAAAMNPSAVVASPANAPSATDRTEPDANATAAAAANTAAEMKPELGPETSKPDNSSSEPEIVIPAQLFEVRDESRMHLLHETDGRAWTWAVENNADSVSDWGARLSTVVSGIAEPFHLTVIGKEAGWSATVPGSSLFRTVSTAPSGVELFDGRLVLQRQGAANEAGTFSLVANGTPITITLPQGDDKVGVSVIPLPAEVSDSDEEDSLSLFPFDSPTIVTIYAADNIVTLSLAGRDEPITIARGKAWQWNTAEDLPSAAGTQLVPEWVFQATKPQPELTKSLMEEAVSVIRGESSVTTGAVTLSTNRNPQLASWGVQLTTITRNVEQLTSYLLQPNEEVVRRQAIAGLRLIIQQSDRGRGRVHSVLETRLSNTELENAMRMLAGVSRTAAEDRFVSGWLVEMLSSSRVALREMAIVNLEELTKERFAFFADDDAGRRGSAVRRWERMLERNDGRLIKPIE